VLHAKYSRYMQRVAEVAPELVDELAEVGARFTHHSSIAPTGTISLSLANNASNGIEPSFAHHYSRNVIREGKKTKEKVDVYSFELLAYRELVNPKAMPYAEDAASPAGLLHQRRRHHPEGARGRAGRRAEVGGFLHLQDRERPHRLPVRGLQGHLPLRPRAGPEGLHHLPLQPGRLPGRAGQGEADLENTTYRFELEDGSVVEVKGNEQIEYDGELHTAANLFDALKEGYYGKF
jgi:ribonucleoside-diphosphate reductase alpha chain